MKAAASSDVRGEAVRYRSLAGVEERCVMLARLPGRAYRDEETSQERALCAINVYYRACAICLKTVSTSPGASIHLLGDGRLDGNPVDLECEMCPRGKGLPHDAYTSWQGVKIAGQHATVECHLCQRLVDPLPPVARLRRRGACAAGGDAQL